jgi:hypothetical protein
MSRRDRLYWFVVRFICELVGDTEVLTFDPVFVISPRHE